MDFVIDQYEKIDRRAVKCWRIGKGIRAALALVAYLVVIIVMQFLTLPATAAFWIYMLIAVLVAISIIGIVVFPAIEYKQWLYIVTRDKVEIRHGIFFIKTAIVPIVRIQHITISQGPLERKFGMHRVKISLASGEQEIVGLTQEKAMAISTYLKERLYARLEEKGEATGMDKEPDMSKPADEDKTTRMSKPADEGKAPEGSN